MSPNNVWGFVIDLWGPQMLLGDNLAKNQLFQAHCQSLVLCLLDLGVFLQLGFLSFHILTVDVSACNGLWF